MVVASCWEVNKMWVSIIVEVKYQWLTDFYTVCPLLQLMSVDIHRRKDKKHWSGLQGRTIGTAHIYIALTFCMVYVYIYFSIVSAFD